MEPQLEGGDIYIEHFLQDQQELPFSSLQEVIQDGHVLLTGSTGLVGSLVLEKLLRSCNRVSKIYVTVRGKDGKTSQQRIKELFSSKVFDLVRLEHCEALEKVQVVDLDRGFETQIAPAVTKVTMIIHCALLVDHYHTIKEAVETNLRFTSTLIQLAYRCRQLESFVVVTSTLCHNGQRIVDEQFYPPPVTAPAMCIMADSLSQDVFTNSTAGLIAGDQSASLTTMCIAEDLVRQSRRSLPLAIVRPSMLVATYKEPLAGWLPRESPSGLTKLLTEAMRGRLCTLRCDDSICAELMPADFAASFILAVAIHTASARRNWKNKEVDEVEIPGQIIPDSDIPIFNLVSSNQNPLSWREFFVCSLRHTRSVPFLDMAWYPYLLLTKSRFWFTLWFYIFHLFPATVIDRFHAFTDNPNILNAKKSRVYRKYMVLRGFCEALSHHTMTSQRYRENNTLALWRTLGVHDRSTFNFDILQLDWDQFLHTLARGVRLYCLGDSLDTIPRASNRLKRLKLLHYSCVVMSSFFILILFRAVLKTLLF
ncbi:fatty acyl-CoA reductase 1-like [Macrosteles quadrilineatus]|uniref:fatty acyl-CoA reductase 1-like n=1 Tax=Macrosteles quadrilineatus TaxID=74068 RepID=UPI0023E33A06|nr:fatty acyl-CoA reductase 1-like [Macrosteles quadrilineatus]XP_054290512.1 fatty acyl-CoA reductase 1-like [Macrosteles quadrilineatus]XP_054290513.1 fatty acyl-CoA reductase 1-like [Macrosteles quadrilineatus]XP_054291009.1 fatty acyl-CoA reductase 1-like [Macrosteles quadrilineatus]XP_054291010.1 fatty acyl-CoA reductase 1-like [Macrosteles quadrilineatus]XP_054291011.1 fatty acyl-CoA reductase 1-like [Macrosteles quadrilineatus]